MKKDYNDLNYDLKTIFGHIRGRGERERLNPLDHKQKIEKIKYKKSSAMSKRHAANVLNRPIRNQVKKKRSCYLNVNVSKATKQKQKKSTAAGIHQLMNN